MELFRTDTLLPIRNYYSVGGWKFSSYELIALRRLYKFLQSLCIQKSNKRFEPSLSRVLYHKHSIFFGATTRTHIPCQKSPYICKKILKSSIIHTILMLLVSFTQKGLDNIAEFFYPIRVILYICSIVP